MDPILLTDVIPPVIHPDNYNMAEPEPFTPEHVEVLWDELMEELVRLDHKDVS